MKVHQTTSICPRLKPVQLPLVGKCLSINSATRIFRRKAMMTGISSVRSWVIVICSLIPRAYLNSYFLAKIRTNCEDTVSLKSEIAEAADHLHNAYNHRLNNEIELIRCYRSYSVTGPYRDTTLYLRRAKNAVYVNKSFLTQRFQRLEEIFVLLFPSL